MFLSWFRARSAPWSGRRSMPSWTSRCWPPSLFPGLPEAAEPGRGGDDAPGSAVRWLPARRRPVIRTELTHRSLSHGWRHRGLGPPAPPHPCRTTHDGGALSQVQRLGPGPKINRRGPRSPATLRLFVLARVYLIVLPRIKSVGLAASNRGTGGLIACNPWTVDAICIHPRVREHPESVSSENPAEGPPRHTTSSNRPPTPQETYDAAQSRDREVESSLPSHQACLEPLETRALLALTTTFVQGVLSINGTNA
jgi:hypothetical protein